MKFQELEGLKNDVNNLMSRILYLEALYEKGQKRFSAKENRLLRKDLVEFKKRVPNYRRSLIKVEKEYREFLKQKW